MPPVAARLSPVARSIYVASLEPFSGKSLIALGLVDLFTRRVERTGVFRPITRSPSSDDHVVDLLVSREGVTTAYDDAVGVTYEDVHGDPDAALTAIVDRYGVADDRCDAVVVVGSDYTDVAGPTELAFNARVAANLGAPMLLVVSGAGRTPDEIATVAEIGITEIANSHATTVGIVANRCDADQVDAVCARVERLGLPVWALPDAPLLSVRDLRVEFRTRNTTVHAVNGVTLSVDLDHDRISLHTDQGELDVVVRGKSLRVGPEPADHPL